MSPSSTTLLVQALLALADPTYVQLDSSLAPASIKIENLKGKGKEVESEVADDADRLEVSDQIASTSTLPSAPIKKAINKLLRYTEHTILVPSTSTLSGSDSATNEVESRVLTSWKMSDFAYKREPCPFPTRARGLFTEKVTTKASTAIGGSRAGEEEYRIIARGYDKFFNVDEVSWTKVRSYSQQIFDRVY